MTTQELFAAWFAALERGEKPIRYRVGEPFNGLDIRPGRLYLFGGPPGAGKTAALLQVSIDLLRLNPDVRLLICNVEMPASALVDRIFARLAGVPLTAIADHATTAEHRQAIRLAYDSLSEVLPRLVFQQPPFTLEHIAQTATDFNATVLVLDYIQRLGCGSSDGREKLETASTVLRGFCDQGAALLVASAVARQKSPSGASSYTGLNLASFRGSSELEYGCDAAYLFNGDGPQVVLTCEKNRYGETADILTIFDKKTQTFGVAPLGLIGFGSAAVAPCSHLKRGRRQGD